MSDKISDRKPDGGLADWIDTYEAMGAGREDAELLMLLIELRARRAAEVTHPDKFRMDWLCAHCVEVRDPQMYGSHAMFHAQQDSEEWDLPHHTTLREQVDAEIKAAGGTVEGEE